MNARTMTILWPSFMMAGVLEGLVFSVVDPTELRFADNAIDASPQAVYTLAFLAFWAVLSTSGALTALLWVDPDAQDDAPREPFEP
ncbi:MAG: hypothetical protein ABJD97_08190 [Betaproteobacteria bacterium]